MPAPPPPRDGVDGRIEQHDDDPEDELRARREPRRIDDRHEIVVDEAARVAGIAGRTSQALLPRRQRADRRSKLGPCGPRDRGQMHPCPPAPDDHQHPAHDDEHDEREMHDHEAIGEQAVQHQSVRGEGRSCGRCTGQRSTGSLRRVPRSYAPARNACSMNATSRIVSTAIAVVLAGCAMSPKPESPVGSAPAPSTGRPGYYLDDGPGDSVPSNLDTIPEPVPRVEPLHRFANRPYSVFGREYVPATSLRPYRERGIASWYGRKFHGEKTATGETYDMYALTAAHP